MQGLFVALVILLLALYVVFWSIAHSLADIAKFLKEVEKRMPKGR